MPFRSDLDELYEQVIRRSLEQYPSLRPLRADEIYGSRAIIADIWESIQDASVLVADVTGRNPNVFYELGLAHASHKPVIIISQNIDDVPFDLKHLRVVVYQNTAKGRQLLSANLRKAINVVRAGKSAGPFTSPTEDVRGSRTRSITPKDVAGLVNRKPQEVLKVLEKMTRDQRDKRSRPSDPEMVSAVINQLDSSYPEVQLAAIQALGALAQPVHAQALRRFLTDDNLTLTAAAARSLGDLQAFGLVPKLIRMLSDESYSGCRDALIASLGEIGGAQAIQFLCGIAKEGGRGDRVRAIEALPRTHSGEQALIKLDPSILDEDERSAFAGALGEVTLESERTKASAGGQLLKLMEDPSSEVRGRAMGSYCALSVPNADWKYFDDRSVMWERLGSEDGIAIEAFFERISGYEPFSTEEQHHLVALLSAHPAQCAEIAYYLKDIGNEEIARTMLQLYSNGGIFQTWALVYFSRIAVPDAEKLLRAVVDDSTDSSHVCLAGVGLMNLGVGAAVKRVLETVFSAHKWVQADVRDRLVVFSKSPGIPQSTRDEITAALRQVEASKTEE